MSDPWSAVLAGTFWFLKFTFLGGWAVTKWLTWLTWPIWAWAFGLGALSGLV
jgi:hypothetical protein